MLFIVMIRQLRRPTLFPYTTLFRSLVVRLRYCGARRRRGRRRSGRAARPRHRRDKGDRKSTRLNSSHLGISYAVFCLKKKRKAPLVEAVEGGTWRVSTHRY